MPRKTLNELRSQRWFGATDLRSFGHRSRMLQMGYFCGSIPSMAQS